MDSIKPHARLIPGMLIVFFIIGCSFFGLIPIKQADTSTPNVGPLIDSTPFVDFTGVATVIPPEENLTQTQTVGSLPAATETVTPGQTGSSLALSPTWTPESTIAIPTETNPSPPENVIVEPTQSASTAKPYPVFGMQLNYLTPAEGVVDSASAGAFWVQSAAVSWQDIEPNEGVRNWAALSGREQEWVNASNLAITPIVTIHFTPAWAQKASGVSCGPIRKDKFDAFGNFLYDLVTRYSQPPYNIKYWQIWNEADAGLGVAAADSAWGCWGDTGDQKYYGGDYFGKMLKAVYPRIKAADPQAQVIIAGLLMDCDPNKPPESPEGSGNYKDCSSSRFLEGILSVGAGDYFDGVSFHSYDYYQGELGKYYNPNWNSSWDKNGVVLTAKSSFIKNVLTQYGARNKSLFNTESSVICGKTGEESVCTDDTFNQTKAYYVVEAYAATLAENLDANLWFSLKGWRASGLIDASMQPVPAYHAYSVASQQLLNHYFTGYITDYSGVKTLAFQGTGQRLWILWSIDGNAHSIQLDSMPSAIYNIYGEAQPVGTQTTIAQAPVYIIWQP
jgi:hypothetical protein